MSVLLDFVKQFCSFVIRVKKMNKDSKERLKNTVFFLKKQVKPPNYLLNMSQILSSTQRNHIELHGCRAVLPARGRVVA